MPNFYRVVNQVIKDADILLLVIDASHWKESVNTELEQKIIQAGKRIIYVVNKVDLITSAQAAAIDLPHMVTVSATQHLSTMRLLRKIMQVGQGKPVTVGVIGYPNTGKSTIINALKGRHSASTSSISGHTKGIQKVRVSRHVVLLDTPGVFSHGNKDTPTMVSIGARDIHRSKDPVGAALFLLRDSDGRIEKHFDVVRQEDFHETLEQIALRLRMLKKGGEPDISRAAKHMVSLWQKGSIR